MRILLLGEYSNVHNTLAKGLRALGHECVVASDGDSWKNYPRDIDLSRRKGIVGKIQFLWRLLKALPRLRGFDVVQLINPVFLELKAEHIVSIYHYLRRHNKKVILGAYGMDYYWAEVNTNIRPLRYSDFNIGDVIRKDEPAIYNYNDWVGTAKEQLCRMIAKDCDWIVSGLYEYWATYDAVPELRHKHTFIPFPIDYSDIPEPPSLPLQRPLRLFVGISKGRSAYKGTDVMLRAARDVERQYPDKLELIVAEGVPFAQYQQMMAGSDAILDQLYSYTPAMNALLAMSKGIINIGGGEPENYEILGESELRPIVNVEPTYESCRSAIEHLVLHPELIPKLKSQSIEYVHRHHNYIRVAQSYVEMYKGLS